jgi:DNA-binding transcriptional regulator YiaG
MGHKKASKPKAKTSYVEVATIGTKTAGRKMFHHGKSGKLYGFKQKPGVAVGKPKMTYSHMPSSVEMHEAGHGMQFADVAPVGLETNPLEDETELADKLVAEVADNSADVNVLCEAYDLKREELGRLTGFSLRALAEWASGKLPSQPARRRLHEVRRLLDALAEIVKRDSIPKWLHQPNPAFDRLTPLQVIELGEIDRLWAMVHDLGSGQPE